MLHPKLFSRESIVQHLVQDHGWQDIDGSEDWIPRGIGSGPIPEKSRAIIRTGDGSWLQSTSEYLAIHRELQALEA